MRYTLPATESPATATRQVIERLLQDIAEQLATAAPLPDKNIHKVRKSCKRMRAMLRMARPGLPAAAYRELDQHIRTLARELSTRRDNKVMLDTLDSISRHFGPLLQASAMSPVRECLLRQIETGCAEAPGHDIPVTLSETMNDIRTVLDQTGTDSITLDTVIAGLTACYRRGRSACAVLQETPDTGNAHALRKQAKYLCYQLNFVSGLNAGAISPIADRFCELEDILGSDHDIAMLVTAITDKPQLCPGHRRRQLLLALAESRRTELLSAALDLAAGLYRDKPKVFRHWLRETLPQPA